MHMIQNFLHVMPFSNSMCTNFTCFNSVHRKTHENYYKKRIKTQQ